MAYDNSSLTGDEIFDNYYTNTFMGSQSSTGWFFYKLWGYSFDYLHDLLDTSIIKQVDNIQNKEYLKIECEKFFSLPKNSMDGETYQLFLEAVFSNTITIYGMKTTLSRYLKIEYNDIIIETIKKNSIKGTSLHNPKPGEYRTISLLNKPSNEYRLINLITTDQGEINIKYPTTKENVEKISLIRPYIGAININFEK